MLSRLFSSAASGIDRVLVTALLGSGRLARARKGPESLGHQARMDALANIVNVYAHDAGDDFFPSASPVLVHKDQVRGLPRAGQVVDVTWPSVFQPYCADIREDYIARLPNQTAAARLFLHADTVAKGNAKRPAVVLLHGYRCGQFPLEERIWPVRWLYQRGLDVALFVLPFHARRSDARGPFPASDPRVTIEGFRQAVLDMRTIGWILKEYGASSVGVMGMSLGGYTASLYATLQDELSFAVPMIPMASIADVARQNDRLVGTPEEKHAQHQALEAVHRVVSPFGRAPRIAGDRVLVLGAEGDRITPIDHAERLANHFDARLCVMRGGHFMQIGRADAFREVGRMLKGLGLLTAPVKSM